MKWTEKKKQDFFMLLDFVVLDLNLNLFESIDSLAHRREFISHSCFAWAMSFYFLCVQIYSHHVIV